LRILIVDTCYPAFLESHYGRQPELRARGYDVQWGALMGTFFGTADSYSHHLRPLGHEAHEVVVNAAPLQRAWARQHLSRRPFPFRRPESLLREQVAWFQPDVLYVQNLAAIPAGRLRRAAAGRPIVGQIASELPPDPQLAAFDLVVTSFPHYVDLLAGLGVEAAYLPLAFDRRVLGHVDVPQRDVDVAFVGSLARGQHGRGNALLARAAEHLPLSVWGVGIDQWPESSPLRSRYHGEAWGLEMFKVLARARIALNRHIDVAKGHANNMRLYEATGMGATLVTDVGSNLDELFAVGDEIAAYDGPEGLLELVRELLGDPGTCERIASAGHRRTLADHTYEQRMPQLAALLADRL
jgi:spore maturation protein CgeB